MGEFPAELFHLGGDPGAIRSSAQGWRSFGDAALEAAGAITSLDTSEFVGPEADLFREKLNRDIPGHLRITGDAYRNVAGALNKFAGELTGLQDEMRPLAHKAPALWREYERTRAQQNQAQMAAAGQEVLSWVGLSSGANVDHLSSVTSAATTAERAWQECINAANGIRTRMTTAASECARCITAAAGTRFAENPTFFERLGTAIGDFFEDPVEALRFLSGALKVVSLIAGLLSFIPPLAPVTAPLALATAGAAFAIDAGLYAATGEGSVTDLVIDGALLALPGVGRIVRNLLPAKGSSSLQKAVNRPRETANPMDGRTACGDPVDVATGEVIQQQTDVELAAALPLVLSRAHTSATRAGRWFGTAWSSTVDQRLEFFGDNICYAAEDSLVLVYPAPASMDSVLPVEGPRWPLAMTDDGGFTITRPESGVIRYFAPNATTVWPIVSIVNRNHHRIDFDYTPEGLLAQIRHSGGYQINVETTDNLITAFRLIHDDHEDTTLINYRYDDNHQLAEVINSSGKSLKFSYDSEGKLTVWRDRNDEYYSYRYDEQGRCYEGFGSGDFLNYLFHYNEQERTTVVTNSLGQKTTYYFNELNQKIREVDPLGNATTFEWDRYDRLLTHTDPLGRTTRYTYDEVGNMVAITRPDGSQATAVFNAMRMPVTTVNYDGTVWQRTYDELGNLTSIINPLGHSSQYEYNELGYIARYTNALGHTCDIETNAAGLPVKITDPLGNFTSYTYDVAGRPTTITDAVGEVTQLIWTTEGKLAERIGADGAREQWRYDGEGNLIEHIDALEQRAIIEVTHLDLPSARIDPDGSRLEFGYDTEMRLVSVTNQQGLVWQYHYDPAGNLIKEIDFNGRVMGYSYDKANQLVERVNGVGQVIRFTRDVLGNITEKRSEVSVTTFEYDPLGRLTRAKNPESEIAFERNALGEITAESCNGRKVTSTFDAIGRRTRRITSSGTESIWEYGAGERPVALHTAGQSIQFAYDANGREITRNFGDNVALTQTWDSAHRLLSQTLAVATFDPAKATSARNHSLAQQREYRYRADGYLTSVTDQLAGARTFALDFAGRVTAVSGQTWQENYAYDAAGNISHASWPEVKTIQHTDSRGEREYSGTLIRRAGRVHYGHDSQGRVTSKQQKRLSAKPLIWKYTWDADDHLTDVVTPDGQHWQYHYDPLGRRVSKQRRDGDESVERIDFVWDGPLLAEQITTAGTATVWDWEPGSFRPISQTERISAQDAPQEWIDREFYSIVTDLVGTPTELVDGSGNIAWHSQITLWGALLSKAANKAYTPLRFPGQYEDPETSFYYNYHRHYDPTTGRYVSNDPLGLAPAPNPQAYVHNPLTWLDPLGLAPYSIKGRLKAAGPGTQYGLPSQGRVRFLPEKGYNPVNPLFRGPNRGYMDRFGNEWCVGPTRTPGQPFEWDVQLSSLGKQQLGWLSPDGRHLNVSPLGEVTH